MVTKRHHWHDEKELGLATTVVSFCKFLLRNCCKMFLFRIKIQTLQIPWKFKKKTAYHLDFGSKLFDSDWTFLSISSPITIFYTNTTSSLKKLQTNVHLICLLLFERETNFAATRCVLNFLATAWFAILTFSASPLNSQTTFFAQSSMFCTLVPLVEIESFPGRASSLID